MIIKFKKLNADITPETLGQINRKKMILESASTDQMKGRFSIVAFDAVGKVNLYDDYLQIFINEDEQLVNERPYESLEDFINDMKVDEVPEALTHLPFISGMIGYCSFDLIRYQNKLLKQIELQSDIPDASFNLVESVYVFDHFKEELFVMASNLFSHNTEAQVEQVLNNMIETLKDISLFQNKIDHTSRGELETNISEEDFMQEVEYYKSLISKGDMFQVVPSRIYKYKHYFNEQHKDTLKLQIYKNLKRQNPSPYMYYIDDEERTIIGSSPESFIKKQGDVITTNPIAGTNKRGQTEEEDKQNEIALITDEKELAEHRMLVDLGRNDLNMIAQTGSVYMPKLMTVERFEHVMHIVSIVEGKIRPEITPLQMITALLPAGTVSGAPKTRAITRIYGSRKRKRGIYAGGVGYINCNHDLDFALTIRTMVVDNEYVNVEAGCGVVYDSNPQKELKETMIKAKSLLEVTP
ncbi:anthranilate synthase component I [Mammaliicoccus sciuri]|jgi:anthranilate synthase component 1|uniref:anthranilate synthase component I n=1 Tax=Mammaliicoccus sciuri TaxID=1296 RepID=UPI000733DA64|nr:anthranilate synthase component I [Mammaliicoccus sciuri]KTT84444.1 anthranilate synthase component I [Mammaliicoccus sciuri]MBA1396421.1 anthranilate synthase component I [Mammaliicoccus sciuri]MBG9205238.1 anthranilate synthase component I [Mammaliicoccus sciuri]MCC2087833.1 anthranilate synthase component I [Mammaliicoccus sciuri]MCD8760242.1 anthranilate synthase component I [Mammaliicoccus sciuri]